MQQPSITIMSHGSDYLTTWNKSSEIWTMATRVGSLWSWVGDSRVGSLSLPSRPLPLIRKLRSAPDQVDQVDQSQHYLWNVVDGLPSCIKSQRISTISFDFFRSLCLPKSESSPPAIEKWLVLICKCESGERWKERLDHAIRIVGIEFVLGNGYPELNRMQTLSKWALVLSRLSELLDWTNP